ncbi:MAG: MarR family transcriptional regulator [Methanomicrobiales archaeon]|nr:MarR family transcriptional regulator [Methanomicrobiales archaeon]
MKSFLLSGVPVLILILVAAQAVPGGQGPTVTYTINLQEDGSAIWNMEYRTPLLTQADSASFQNYSELIQSVSLPDYTELMKKSATEASIATARPVGVSDFSADAAVQSGPTGSYGVVHYRCRWSGFARTGDLLTVGDVFVGGLYLGKDHALIIRPPPGFAVADASPQPDGSQDGLVWYGMRSFGAGEPRVVLRKDPVPWVPGLLILGVAGLAIGLYVSRKRFLKAPPISMAGPAPGTMDPGASLVLEDRILALLREREGSLFQSEIVELLGLPKSTVSEAINRLHETGQIEKVRKGRENLIRLTGKE